MRKLISLILFSLFAFSFTGSDSQAQSVEELESAGMQHYKKAHYNAIPQKNRAMADKEFALAENAFRKAIEKRPQRVNAYIHLGHTYSAQRKYAEAAETYRSALVIAPSQKRIWLRLAAVLEKKGDYPGAINALEALRALENDERAIHIIDDFIDKIEMRAAGTGSESSQTGERP